MCILISNGYYTFFTVLYQQFILTYILYYGNTKCIRIAMEAGMLNSCLKPKVMWY
jgi:hypothetical protein